jgi:hypothetical protein
MSTFVATADGVHALGDGTVGLKGRQVDALAALGRDLWAIVDGHELWQLSGVDWKPVASVEEPRLNCLNPHDRGLLLGTSEARLFAVRDGGVDVVSSFDAAPGREAWFTPWGGPPDVRSMATADSLVFVNVHVGGILRTEDLHAWTPTIEIDSDVHHVLVHQIGRAHV